MRPGASGVTGSLLWPCGVVSIPRGACIVSIPTAIVVGVGAEQGLGAALCRRFSAGGYHVFVAGRTASRIESVARAIVAAGGRAERVETNTINEGDVARLFDRAMAPGGELAPA